MTAAIQPPILGYGRRRADERRHGSTCSSAPAICLLRRTPAIYPWREYVDTGGLISYGVNLVDQYRRSAGYVDKILKGANPGELAIQLPTKFELVINLKTARAIGLAIPAPVLAQAAE
jgi:putative ABC transport system substrate-binding protein